MGTTHPSPVYRMTQFHVPAAARAEFLARLREADALLLAQPGLVRNTLLEQPPAEDGSCRIVTLAEWRDAAAMEAAAAEIKRQQAAQGFDPQQLRARLHIQAETSQYRPLVP